MADDYELLSGRGREILTLRKLDALTQRIDTMSITTDKELADIQLIKTSIENNTKALADSQAVATAQAAQIVTLTATDATDQATIAAKQAEIDKLTAAATASAAQVVADNAPVLSALDALVTPAAPAPSPNPAPGTPPPAVA